MSLFKLKT